MGRESLSLKHWVENLSKLDGYRGAQTITLLKKRGKGGKEGEERKKEKKKERKEERKKRRKKKKERKEERKKKKKKEECAKFLGTSQRVIIPLAFFCVIVIECLTQL